MLPLRFVGLLVLLLAVQGWCKPAKSSEGEDYNDDDPPSEYNDNDTADDEENPSAVEEPPVIMSESQSIHVRTGETFQLPCIVKNTEKVTVTWKKDDEFLYYDSNAMKIDERIVRLPNNTLVIHNATVNDTSNDYDCSILDDPPITIKHRVLVDPKPHKVPLIRVTPGKKVEVNAGENLTLGCEMRIQPTPEIKWYHENERIHDKAISKYHITITDVNRHDAGRYQCLAETGLNNPPVEAINVVVNYAPEIETKGKSKHTGVGVESSLTCIVHAHPHAKVTWLKDQEEVLPENDIEITGNKTKHVLDILHTKREHFGNYTCVAENKMGRAEKTISLTGIPSQAIISAGEMTKTANGMILKWQLESYSPITEYRLKYRRKGDDTWITLKPTVKNGKGSQFIVEHAIEGLQPGSYEAILMARNDFGWSTPSKPHTFIGEYEDEQAENVKGSPSSASQSALLSITTLFLVFSSHAFTNL